MQSHPSPILVPLPECVHVLCIRSSEPSHAHTRCAPNTHHLVWPRVAPSAVGASSARCACLVTLRSGAACCTHVLYRRPRVGALCFVSVLCSSRAYASAAFITLRARRGGVGFICLCLCLCMRVLPTGRLRMHAVRASSGRSSAIQLADATPSRLTSATNTYLPWPSTRPRPMQRVFHATQPGSLHTYVSPGAGRAGAYLVPAKQRTQPLFHQHQHSPLPFISRACFGVTSAA